MTLMSHALSKHLSLLLDWIDFNYDEEYFVKSVSNMVVKMCLLMLVL